MALPHNGTLACGIIGLDTCRPIPMLRFILVHLLVALLPAVATSHLIPCRKLLEKLAVRSQALVVSCSGVKCPAFKEYVSGLYSNFILDTSQAYMNNRLDQTTKGLLMDSSSCNPSDFVYPPCDAPAWDRSGRTYSAGNRVSYK